MRITLIGPGILKIPPKGWGAVEILINDHATKLKEAAALRQDTSRHFVSKLDSRAAFFEPLRPSSSMKLNLDQTCIPKG